MPLSNTTSIREARLSFVDDSINSDKVYVLSMHASNMGYDQYVVVARYGRRGGTMQTADYGTHSRYEAVEVFERKLREKLRKGYVPDDEVDVVRAFQRKSPGMKMTKMAKMAKKEPDYYVVPDEEEI